MTFEFATATRIVFGPGTAQTVAPAAREMLIAGGSNQVLVVTGRDGRRASALLDGLQAAGMVPLTLAVAHEPTVELAERGVRLAREADIALVIAIGGGSVLDAGKAIAALATHPGGPRDYLEVIGHGKSLSRAPLPFIAVPTTAGTGSEVTRNAVLASPEERVNVSLRHPLMLPRLAVVDPQLMLDLPAAITASTGMDALTQLIEPFTSCRAQPMTDALCREGLRRGAGALPRAYAHPDDLAARGDMCIASLLGGMALANAGLGAAHGLAAPLGGMFPAPHGAVCAALIPAVMEINVLALRKRAADHPALAKYDELGGLLTGRADARADDAVDFMQHLNRQLAIPPLSTYGVTADDLPMLIEKGLAASSMKANPIVLTTDELNAILVQAW